MVESKSKKYKIHEKHTVLGIMYAYKLVIGTDYLQFSVYTLTSGAALTHAN